MDQIANFTARLTVNLNSAQSEEGGKIPPLALELIADVSLFFDNYHITSKTRKRETVMLRHILIYALFRYTTLPLTDIGKLVGGRDHTTVIHSLTTIKDLMDVKHPDYVFNVTSYLEAADKKYKIAKRHEHMLLKYSFNF